MLVDKKIVGHVAKVARLDLKEEEIKELLPQLKEILSAFSKIQEADTEDTAPSFNPIGLKNSLREDNLVNPISQEDALRNCANKKEGYIKGPKVL